MKLKLCGKPAIAAFEWPGGGMFPVCQEHLEKGKRVARALGFPLIVGEAEETASCVQKISVPTEDGNTLKET